MKWHKQRFCADCERWVMELKTVDVGQRRWVLVIAMKISLFSWETYQKLYVFLLLHAVYLKQRHAMGQQHIHTTTETTTTLKNNNKEMDFQCTTKRTHKIQYVNGNGVGSVTLQNESHFHFDGPSTNYISYFYYTIWINISFSTNPASTFSSRMSVQVMPV